MIRSVTLATHHVAASAALLLHAEHDRLRGGAQSSARPLNWMDAIEVLMLVDCSRLAGANRKQRYDVAVALHERCMSSDCVDANTGPCGQMHARSPLSSPSMLLSGSRQSVTETVALTMRTSLLYACTACGQLLRPSKPRPPIELCGAHVQWLDFLAHSVSCCFTGSA